MSTTPSGGAAIRNLAVGRYRVGSPNAAETGRLLYVGVHNVGSRSAKTGMEPNDAGPDAPVRPHRQDRYRLRRYPRHWFRHRRGPPEFVETMRTSALMQRIAEPGEMVGPALLLVSDAGSFITGQTLIADGGVAAH